MITSLNQLNPHKKYTYADYLAWDLKERVELIMGKILKMSPGPSTRHQQISWQLSQAIGRASLPDGCLVFMAPFDVRLYTEDEKGEISESVVQPDVCIVCNRAKLDKRGCDGPPDLMLEIISPSSAHRDLKIKYDLYEKAGVPEYWVVNTVEQCARVFYRNEKGVFVKNNEYMQRGVIKSVTIPGMEVRLEDLFPPFLVEEAPADYAKEAQ